MNNNIDKDNISRLCQIMATLRSETGCPWDRGQTPESLKPYILEEACELLEAIDRGDLHDIRDELGDLLLQVVFLAQIYREQNCFNMDDVMTSICEKMIRRHPHVFADADAAGHSRRWDEIKSRERKDKRRSERLAERIPPTLPALKRAQKLSKKMPAESPHQLLADIDNQHQELQKLLNAQPGASHHIKTTMADILMLTAQLCASLKIDAEDLLRQKTTSIIRAIDEKN